MSKSISWVGRPACDSGATPIPETLKLNAGQAVDVGGYREVSILVDVEGSTLGDGVLFFETADEPFDALFVPLIGTVTETTLALAVDLTATGSTHFYCREFGRYLRWNTEDVSGTTESYARFQVQILAKGRG